MAAFVFLVRYPHGIQPRLLPQRNHPVPALLAVRNVQRAFHEVQP